jgi:glycosyltransferase involved in cell wall biosynthesis
VISIVVPARGVASTLERTVDSALSDRDLEVEVILVVDGPDPDTEAVADQLARRAHVRVVKRAASGGPAVARNDGLRRASGEFVVFLDGDDELRPGGLRALSQGLGALDVAALGRFRPVNDEGQEVDLGEWVRDQLRPVVRRHDRLVDSDRGFDAEAILTKLVTPPPGAVLVRRSAAMAVGGYDTRVGRSEDIDFLVRLSELGTLTPVDVVVLDYRRRSGQRSAHERRRQLGRQRTLARLIWRAPDVSSTRARGRGVVAHHLSRASVRWQHRPRDARDVAASVRSLALVGTFRILTTLAVQRHS